MIESLTLRGFKSYRGQQTIRFTKGVNKISGRNASGKTTILEAVLFGLFGEVPGVEKRDLLPVGGGDLFVELVFRTPKGVKVTIHREATLTKKGTDEAFKAKEILMQVEGEKAPITRERDAQDRLRELLGISSGTFFNVVYARQKEFVDILNPDRGRMNAILGLTAPSEIREQLREVRKQLEQRGELPLKPAFEERIRNAEKTLAEGGAQLTEITGRKATLVSELQVKRFELQNAKDAVERVEGYETTFTELDAIQQEYELNRRLREKKEDELEGVASEMGESPDMRLRELETRANTAKATEDRLRQLSDAEVEQRRRAAAATADRLTHQITEHRELKDKGLTVCPKCGQPIDPAAIEKDLAQWATELETAKKQQASAVAEIQELRAQAKTATDKRIDAGRALDRFLDLRASLDKGKRDMLKLDEEGAALNERLELGTEGLTELVEKEFGPVRSIEDARRRVDEKLKTLRATENQLGGEVRDRSARFQEADASEKRLKAQLAGVEQTLKESRERLGKVAEYEAKIRALDGVVERYGAYERDLRDNTLRLLEYTTFEYFRRLTDQQLYSSCKIDRERYTLEVQPKGSPRSLPAWRAGGGHQSLFALAERLALLRVRNFPYLLILDEPTDAVDSENVPHLLEYIARGSREIGQVLLVTHHGQGEEEGVNLIRVQKIEGESKVTQELAYG
ncbi:MAG: SMC family ATPase [Candidatus Bathyarchaeota archaeon]|nr:SMC family ATPase [Candidatus Bathyarchaeota archaeon]